ncbi:hypothetical protein [Candidatus Poriferisocius sp.]|uniref:hypothetical protein n=1 Tax=Candidatus Poriferisocius sp. TaxID=3101276 RepID=UPI003B01AEA0
MTQTTIKIEAADRRAAINEWRAAADGNRAAANLCEAAGDHARTAEHRAAATKCLARSTAFDRQ